MASYQFPRVFELALLSLVVTAPILAQADTTAFAEAARVAVQSAWEKEVQPYSESGLQRINIHTVQSRNRLARGVHLVHAFAEAAWWKDSRHYLFLMRSQPSGPEILYRTSGGTGNESLTYRLVDVGATSRRFALQISDPRFENEDTTGTWTTLVLHLPENDRFAEVFRELTTYRPPSPHGYASNLRFSPADGPMREIILSTELLKDGQTVDRVESTFTWQDSTYQGTMPLPEAWRAELPKRARRQQPIAPSSLPVAESEPNLP